MRADPEQQVKLVRDETSFIEFLDVLAQDKEAEDALETTTPSSPYGPGQLGWENGCIASYLSAATAFGQTYLSNGGIAPGANPWRVCAEILLGGKYYE
ncbi:hypothetical protein [Pelagibius sp. Alg239-R121]|uniref:DUF7660 family protein n=1 Tax=Pelagibius sp. Alg239-R121 TaxID=2993448 RepID=UPI0024A651C0|nr:hypothetical protein [Pelagibius sp. Alg239-R121]